MAPTTEPINDEDRRGGDGTPAEGRRNYDAADSAVDRIDIMLSKVRRIGLGIGFLLAIGASTVYWLGARGVGPGTRADQLQVIVDRNKVERAYNDSIISQRLSRLERVVTTMAYESCMSGSKTQPSDCAKIFTDAAP